MRALRAGARVVKPPPLLALGDAKSPALVERFRALTLFAEHPDAARAARDMARTTFRDWGLASLAEDARLVVSELVSNAIHHTSPDKSLTSPGALRRIDLTFRGWPRWIFIGVTDEDSTPPMLPLGEVFSPALIENLPEALLPDSGRGLRIVQALTDAVWWVPGANGGKTVVCRFDLGADRLGNGTHEWSE
ncbi:ATP-binding protein [Streptomyces roseoverticillatus]|nr:ATP-binding protein [Streptomyces roseoverticillatus]